MHRLHSPPVPPFFNIEYDTFNLTFATTIHLPLFHHFRINRGHLLKIENWRSKIKCLKRIKPCRKRLKSSWGELRRSYHRCWASFIRVYLHDYINMRFIDVYKDNWVESQWLEGVKITPVHHISLQWLVQDWVLIWYDMGFHNQSRELLRWWCLWSSWLMYLHTYRAM